LFKTSIYPYFSRLLDVDNFVDYFRLFNMSKIKSIFNNSVMNNKHKNVDNFMTLVFIFLSIFSAFP